MIPLKSFNELSGDKSLTTIISNEFFGKCWLMDKRQLTVNSTLPYIGMIIETSGSEKLGISISSILIFKDSLLEVLAEDFSTGVVSWVSPLKI